MGHGAAGKEKRKRRTEERNGKTDGVKERLRDQTRRRLGRLTNSSFYRYPADAEILPRSGYSIVARGERSVTPGI